MNTLFNSCKSLQTISMSLPLSTPIQFPSMTRSFADLQESSSHLTNTTHDIIPHRPFKDIPHISTSIQFPSMKRSIANLQESLSYLTHDVILHRPFKDISHISTPIQFPFMEIVDDLQESFSHLTNTTHDVILHRPSKNILHPSIAKKLCHIVGRSIDPVLENITKYYPPGIKKLETAIQIYQSNNSEHWTHAMLSIRRILEGLAKKMEPNNTSEKYFTILKKYINKDTVELILLQSIINELNDGVHNTVSDKNQVEKVLKYICLLLDKINWSQIK